MEKNAILKQKCVQKWQKKCVFKARILKRDACLGFLLAKKDHLERHIPIYLLHVSTHNTAVITMDLSIKI